MMRYLKKIIIAAVIVMISISAGVFIGVSIQKRQMQVSAIGYWLMGVDSLKKQEYDYALLYLSQAIGLKNDDPLFYEAMGEAYAAKQNITMALDFYKLALDGYKREKRGPIKTLEHKIELLQANKLRGQDTK